MRKLLTLFVTCAMLVSCSVIAAAQDDGRRALAEELLNLMNMKDNSGAGLAMVKQMISGNSAMMKQNSARPDDMAAKISSDTEKFFDKLAADLSWDKMKDDYITMYAETYTAYELKGIIAFYKSPAGQAFSKKQPELMKKGMELSRARIMPKILEMQGEMMNERKAARDARKQKMKERMDATQQEQNEEQNGKE